jgi:hypothetical protein
MPKFGTHCINFFFFLRSTVHVQYALLEGKRSLSLEAWMSNTKLFVLGLGSCSPLGYSTVPTYPIHLIFEHCHPTLEYFPLESVFGIRNVSVGSGSADPLHGPDLYLNPPLNFSDFQNVKQNKFFLYFFFLVFIIWTLTSVFQVNYSCRCNYEK